MGALPQLAWSTTLRTIDELLPFCQKVAEWARAVSVLRILDGRFLDVTFAAGASSANGRHGLGRQFYGVIVVRSTNATGTPALTTLDPVSVKGLGADPAVFIALGSAAPFPSAATVTLWVF